MVFRVLFGFFKGIVCCYFYFFGKFSLRGKDVKIFLFVGGREDENLREVFVVGVEERWEEFWFRYRRAGFVFSFGYFIL